jgi:UDP-glucose 4-epimerase
VRVLISGMGGELGTRVALLLEQERSVEALAGIDVDPPRRRLRRARFTRVEPRDRRRTRDVVRAFAPDAVIHLGVEEPDARSTPAGAAERTVAAADAVLGAAEECALRTLVVRSGIEVYGRAPGSVTVPDESVPPAPGSPFGRSLLEVERAAAATGRRAGVPVTALRFAPVVGPHVPSPLGRYLRLPAVAFSAVADPPFSVVHHEDAARAVARALLFPGEADLTPLNVVAPGAVTAAQAARRGGRLVVPVVGPGWEVARRLAALAGAPVPGHVVELLRRGRTADGGRARRLLGLRPLHRTADAVAALYEWAPVTHLRVVAGDGADERQAPCR